MEPEVEAPADETPSADGAPVDDTEETPSEESEGEAAEDLSDEQDAEGDEDAAAEKAAEDEEDEAWRKLEAKFAHIKNPRDRRAAMARAYWEKTNYASSLRKELEKKGSVDREPAKDEPPPPPHPDLQKLDQRIDTLSRRDEAAEGQQKELLKTLREADADITRLETRLADAADDEYKKQVLEARLETARGRKERLLEKWADLGEKRQAYNEDYQRLKAERDFTARIVEQEQKRQREEAQTLEQFNETFPQQVSAEIDRVAKELKAPKEILDSLRETVTDRLSMALLRLGNQGVDEVDWAAMTQKFVKSHLSALGLATRKAFADTSKGKLAVTGRPPAKAGTSAQTPVRKGPVPPTSLGRGDSTPAMLKARMRLASRGL